MFVMNFKTFFGFNASLIKRENIIPSDFIKLLTKLVTMHCFYDNRTLAILSKLTIYILTNSITIHVKYFCFINFNTLN